MPMVAGTGIKNKLLEALRPTASPVLRSPLAIQKPSLTDGVDVLSSAKPQLPTWLWFVGR
jgi:hypothetical protein